MGLSPRGRGKHGGPADALQAAGSIPAWAGETGRQHFSRLYREVYPRVGGGNDSVTQFALLDSGLSPRGRGKPGGQVLYISPKRSIPAWAGETSAWAIMKSNARVYPRVGGGNVDGLTNGAAYWGLSLRGRGKPDQGPLPHDQERSIPAWAGETSRRRPPSPASRVYPRVGGGNRPPSTRVKVNRGLSPRGRGKLGQQPVPNALARSIPAWAGETVPRTPCRCRSGVYPRVGGGNLTFCPSPRTMSGLSPRGRGKLGIVVARVTGARSIPAWAGETHPLNKQATELTVYPRVGGGNRKYILTGS